MDETYFDEGLPGNFETATLEITKELDSNEFNIQNAAFAGKYFIYNIVIIFLSIYYLNEIKVI